MLHNLHRVHIIYARQLYQPATQKQWKAGKLHSDGIYIHLQIMQESTGTIQITDCYPHYI
jgi:hypothetical protein